MAAGLGPPRKRALIYLSVEDADTLRDEFGAVGAEQGREVHSTGYGTREFAHIDPDGNLLLFSSPLSGEQDGDPAAVGSGLPAAQRQRRDDSMAFEFAAAIKKGDASPSLVSWRTTPLLSPA